MDHCNFYLTDIPRSMERCEMRISILPLLPIVHRAISHVGPYRQP
jgi:hypothetical protein